MRGPSENERRVLHVIDSGESGGAETLFCQLIERTTALGWQPTSVVPPESWLSHQLPRMGVEPTIISARGSMNAKYLGGLVKLVNAVRPDIVHAHLLGSTIYASLAGLVTRTPTIGVIHGPTDLEDPGRLAFLKRWLLSHGCSRLVAVSSSTRDALESFGVNSRAISVIANGVDTASFIPGSDSSLRERLALREGDLLVGAVGNIQRPKAYDVLIQSAALVLERVPEAYFAVVGGGEESLLTPLCRLRETLGITRRFCFTGFIESKASLYQNFDVFVSSSSTEGLSLSLLEAMATERAIVATRSGGAEEALESERSGVLVSTADPHELADALVRLLTNGNLRKRLGPAARERVGRRFSLDTTVGEYDRIYRSLLNC